ncbi:MAG: histidine--tRNA ligase [Pseudomonadota bacterium]
MSQKIQPVRGMKDILPDDYLVVDHITNTAWEIAKRYGFQRMATPVLEHSGVFSRSLGESSDVVSKEMYSFLDKSDDSLTMRPEFTAGIMRAFISEGLQHQLPLRLFTNGPCFRYDRPQAGRFRQFHHLNYEFLGLDSPYADAEMLCLARDLCEGWGILQDVTLEVNSLGCAESRKAYQATLFEYFSSHKDKLSEDSQRRLLKNPMRILDSKDEGDKIIVSGAEVMADHYTDESRKYFDEVLRLLEVMKINYVVNPKLVRGLDYYCHTAFEFTAPKFNSLSILGGGRYDCLAKIMGGPDTPACGFAAGLERIMLLREFSISPARPCVVVSIGDENFEHGVAVVQDLRKVGAQVIFEHKGKIGKRMQNADKAKAKYVVFIGSDEVASKKYKMKDMDSGVETLEDLQSIMNVISSI